MSLRIIAGDLRGRNLLPPPKGAETRPMTGLAKKSLFDTLAPWLAGATVADLYCGTGTLGLEAISRGAGRVYFAEKEPPVIARLKRNIETLGAGGRSIVWRGDVMSRLSGWLAGADPLDIVFLDPPYEHVRRWEWDQVEGRLFAPLAKHLGPEGVVLLRGPGKVEFPASLGGLVQTRIKHYGDMAVAFFSPPEAPPRDDAS